jgi:AhpD family alkylhydroperoxidase
MRVDQWEVSMETRLEFGKVAPEAYEAMRAFSGYTATAGLPAALVELVEIRASQLNGCAFCLQMHTRAAREKGVSEAKLALLPAWREAPVYDARERAALAWTEAVTMVAADHVPDDVYAVARAAFSEEELVKLTLIVTIINSWNRLMVAFRVPPQV